VVQSCDPPQLPGTWSAKLDGFQAALEQNLKSERLFGMNKIFLAIVAIALTVLIAAFVFALFHFVGH
jgi:hypothetical protein